MCERLSIPRSLQTNLKLDLINLRRTLLTSLVQRCREALATHPFTQPYQSGHQNQFLIGNIVSNQRKSEAIQQQTDVIRHKAQVNILQRMIACQILLKQECKQTFSVSILRFSAFFFSFLFNSSSKALFFSSQFCKNIRRLLHFESVFKL